jgi:hypothetical protein
VQCVVVVMVTVGIPVTGAARNCSPWMCSAVLGELESVD